VAAAAAASRAAALADWLRQQGADIDAIQFKQSDKLCADVCGVFQLTNCLTVSHSWALAFALRSLHTRLHRLPCIALPLQDAGRFGVYAANSTRQRATWWGTLASWASLAVGL
jgi:hypothetical protein